MPDHTDHTRPERPSRAYLDAVARETAGRAAAAEPLTSPHDGAPEALRAAVAEGLNAVRDEIVALSRALHAEPETAFREHRSVAAVAELLARHGVEAEVGVHGLDTALRARTGNGGGPTVAVLAEYDALPGLGHACGHNVIAAAAVGAGLGLAALADDLGLTV
ncbi:MAG: amidohydrolase, partial [Pseudonocardia sp.]|nr:amidohydrolase [Pseudonocardia sp.]